MGGSQSGPRVITVETGEGETEIKVSYTIVITHVTETLHYRFLKTL